MRYLCLALGICLAAHVSPAGVALETWGADRSASHPETLKIADAEGGAVVTVDLSKLPAGTKVHTARLFMERAHVVLPVPKRGEEPAPIPNDALAACKVYAGSKPKGKPLEIVGPWFNCLDATAAVTAAVGGSASFFVESLPDWRKERTFLEVCYEGSARQWRPKQVTDLAAVHRSGQTFITFREVQDVVGADEATWEEFQKLAGTAESKQRTRYHIFRSDKPISAETLREAERLAVLEPLSGWNVNGRNSERAIDEKLAHQYALIHGHWNPFADARADGPWGVGCPIDRFVIPGRDANAPGRALARNEGLYVHTVAGRGKAYYAVVVSVDGAVNTTDFRPGNSLAQAVEEAPAECQPVLQRELPPLPYWNYPEKRLHYVHWAAGHFANLPCRYYNWSVAVPDEFGKDVPLELSLPREDRSYWRTQYRIERDSIVITPYDFPVETWWYGYHEALGTLKGFSQGLVRNYTERRLLWFVEWACRKWPVDRDRILVTAMRRSSGGAGGSWSTRGCSTGGALHLGLRHRQIFSSIQVGTNARPDCAAEVAPSMIQVWGKPEWGIKTDTGKTVWDELNLVKLVSDLPATEDLPLVTMTGRGTTDSERAFYKALLAKGQAVMASFGYWGGPKLLPVSASGTWPAPMMRLDVRRDLPLPAFRAVALERAKGTTSTIPDEIEKPYGQINAQLRWSSSDAVDKPNRAELALWAEIRGGEVATDIILRRLVHFKPAAGSTCRWEYGPADGQKQSGELTVGADGLLVVPGVKIGPSTGRLVVAKK